MTTKPALTAQRREETGKGVARKLRAAGRLPAVVYGKDMESVPLSLDAHETRRLFESISVENTIVALTLAGEDHTVDTLVREVQAHPLRNDILHVDFLRIQEGVAVEVEVPVELEGTPAGVRDEGGVLEQQLYEVRVECVPGNIPEVLTLDVSALEIGDALHVADITVGEGVEVLTDSDRAVCIVVAPRIVEEEVEAEEIEVLEPEAAEAAEAEEPEGSADEA